MPTVNESAVRAHLQDQELAIGALVPGLLEGSTRASWLADEGALPESLRFAQRYGCGVVIVGGAGGEAAAAPILRRMGAQAAASGVTLAVQDDDAARLRALLELVGHPAVSAVWTAPMGRLEGPLPLGAVWVRGDEISDLDASGALDAIAQRGAALPVVVDLESTEPEERLAASTAALHALRRAARAARSAG